MEQSSVNLTQNLINTAFDYYSWTLTFSGKLINYYIIYIVENGYAI